jgi:hypothetical protein
VCPQTTPLRRVAKQLGSYETEKNDPMR